MKEKNELKNFWGLVLCDYSDKLVDVHIRASLIDGALSISGHDIGSSPEEFWGDDDYEYWYNFTAEETYRLLEKINGLDEPQKALTENFSELSGLQTMREICEKENIEYSFFSYV